MSKNISNIAIWPLQDDRVFWSEVYLHYIKNGVTHKNAAKQADDAVSARNQCMKK